METGDYIITLKDKSEWTSAFTLEELVSKMEEKLVVLAGVKFEFQQPIQMRFNELMTGSKQDVAVKIFGDDLNTLAFEAAEVEKLILNIEGVEDINVEKVTGLAQIQINYDRNQLAQYGLSVKDINMVLRTAFAGSQAGVVFDEEKRFGLVVRLDKDYRQNPDDVKSLTVPLPGGGQIPFDQLANIEIKSAPAQVSRENTKRRITVGFNVRNRDVESVISEVSGKIDQNMKLPTGYYISYGGQFQNLQAARARLSVAVPVALLLIFILLYFTFHSVKQTLLIYTAVPMAAIGGIFALWIRDMNFSISAGVGFIALFGVAVLNGIVLIAEFNRLEKEGITSITERVMKGLRTRLRPVIMTASVASFGFLPMALSTSAGAEVQKPLATVVIGGLITATLLTLVILPIFYVFFNSEKPVKKFKFKQKNSIALLFIFIGCSFLKIDLNAQEAKRISLQDAIQLALDNNLEIKSSGMSVNAMKALKSSSLDIGKTNFDVQYGQFNSILKDNSLAVTQTFSFPTVYYWQNRLANEKIKGSEWQLKGSMLEIATQVKQVYYHLLYLQSKKDLLSYQDSLFTGFLRAAELRSKAGETNRLEMITARSQSLEVKNQMNHVESDIKISSGRLQTLLNTNDLLYPSEVFLKKEEITVSSDSNIISQNPTLGYLRQQADIAYAEKKLEGNRFLPDLNIGYFSQTIQGTQEVNGSPVTFGKGDRFTGLQAGIALPLWFLPYTAKTKAARINEDIALTNAEYFEKTLSGNYKSLLHEYSKYSASVDFYEKQALPEAEIIIRQSELSYKAGAMDYLDYVQSLARALIIKQNYLDAINSLNQTKINIEFFTGKIF